MNLKPLKKRLHNIMFHTHTVAGIVISFALFVIFYAGAFSLFRHEIYRWENPLARFESKKDIDFDATVKFIENYINEPDIFKNINITPPSKVNPFIKFYGAYKKPIDKKKFLFCYINTKEIHKYPYNFYDKSKSLTFMSDTIYQLHYFKQLPVIGKYLAGLVAIFFLFAIITGILIHWKNIVNKFYDFRIAGKWKQIWANTHTSIGVITLPFQIIFAITGSLLVYVFFFLTPSALLLTDTDTKPEAIGNTIRTFTSPIPVIKYDENAKDIDSDITINKLYQKVTKEYPNCNVKTILTNNLGKEDGTIKFKITDHKSIAGNGELFYRYKDGSLIKKLVPNKKSYTDGVYAFLVNLHLSHFGGILLKIIYFIIAMLTCYVITSGVMIWKTARETSKYTDKQKRFHHRVTKFYLALTSSLFPAIALIFIANKIFPISMEYRAGYVEKTFFIGWLILMIVSLFWNNYAKLQRRYLLIGSTLALLIPVFNGVVTGDWLWETLINNQYYVFSVDFTWLLTGLFGFVIYSSLVKAKNKNIMNLTNI